MQNNHTINEYKVKKENGEESYLLSKIESFCDLLKEKPKDLSI